MFLIFYRYPPSFPSSSPTHFLFYPFSSWTSWILSPNQLEIRKSQVNNLWSNDCLSLLHILPIEGSKISLKLASQAHIKKEMNSSQRTHTSFSFPLLPAMTLSLSHHSSSPGPFLSQPWSTEIPLPPSLPGVGSLFFGSWSQTHSLPGTSLLYPKSRLASCSPKYTTQSAVLCSSFPVFSLQRWRRKRADVIIDERWQSRTVRVTENRVAFESLHHSI